MKELLREALPYLKEHSDEYYVPESLIERIEAALEPSSTPESTRRLKQFIDAAKRLSFIPYANIGEEKVVKLSDVRHLLCNLHDGNAPDYIPPPIWASKDCVGYLMQRGWKLTDDHSGMHRRGYFIPADAIEHSGIGGPESTADMLEIEKSERTDIPG